MGQNGTLLLVRLGVGVMGVVMGVRMGVGVVLCLLPALGIAKLFVWNLLGESYFMMPVLDRLWLPQAHPCLRSSR